ncbi:ribbon-helix-helix domain-containing protein [Dyella monticola]|uniref:ribbon-helix-helix domain-containing protein n=1 Tax=Dyella monticola TaxID=1927958 RepID=UPI001E62131E|nr:ribbon-helix-helix domain-containing protein [Dyella monticola]
MSSEFLSVENDKAWFSFKSGKSSSALLEGLDKKLTEPRPKSIRLDGMSTCVRLEGVYWAILKTMASYNEMTTNVLLTAMDREVQLRLGGAKNFSSLIRVMSTTQLLRMCPDEVVTKVMQNIE